MKYDNLLPEMSIGHNFMLLVVLIILIDLKMNITLNVFQECFIKEIIEN